MNAAMQNWLKQSAPGSLFQARPMFANQFPFILLVILLLGFSQKSHAQTTDSLQLFEEPVAEKKTGFFAKDYPNPKKALILSFVLPGAGQAYNKKWWKIPLVYGALGTVAWIEANNIRQYTKLRDNYKYLVDDDPNTNPFEEPYIYLDATQTKFYRDEARRTLEQSSLVLGLVYVLAATDAFVDAHLNSFDVSDDLSFNLRPRAIPNGLGQPAIGLGISIPLHGQTLGSGRSRLIQP